MEWNGGREEGLRRRWGDGGWGMGNVLSCWLWLWLWLWLVLSCLDLCISLGLGLGLDAVPSPVVERGRDCVRVVVVLLMPGLGMYGWMDRCGQVSIER
jgi:hypothetical protein